MRFPNRFDYANRDYANRDYAIQQTENVQCLQDVSANWEYLNSVINLNNLNV